MLENLRYLTLLGILFLMKNDLDLLLSPDLKCLTSSTGGFENRFITNIGSDFLL